MQISKNLPTHRISLEYNIEREDLPEIIPASHFPRNPNSPENALGFKNLKYFCKKSVIGIKAW